MRREEQKKVNYRKIRRNIRAISPVISVLMMIAVAVAASLVTYAWVMGYLGFTTNKVGKAIQIQSVAYDDPNDAILVYVQNVGDSPVTLSDVYVNGVLNGTSTPTAEFSPEDGLLEKTDTAEITLTTYLSQPDQITIKVVTTDGTFIEYTKTF